MPPAPTTPLQPSEVPTNSKKRKRDEVDLPPPPTRSQRSSKRLKQETNVTLSLFLQKLREEKQHLPQEKTQPIKHLTHYNSSTPFNNTYGPQEALIILRKGDFLTLHAV